jgi:hypothetical protein
MNSVVPISTNSLVTDARDEPEFITNSTLRVSTISCNPEEYHDKVIRIIGYYLVEHEKSVLLNGGKPYDSRGIWVSGRPPLTSISDTIKWGKVPGFVEIVGLFSSKHNPQYLEMGEYVGEITRLVSGRYLMNDEAEHLGLHIAYASNVVINGSAEMSPTP